MQSESRSCPTAKELWSYSKGESSAAQIRTVEEHLAGCLLCSGTVDGFSSVPSASSLTDLERNRPVPAKSINWKYAGVMMGLIALIALLWWNYQSGNSQQHPSTVTQVNLKSQEKDLTATDASNDVSLQDTALPINGDPTINTKRTGKSGVEKPAAWNNELFTIEKRGIGINGIKVNDAEISGRPEVSVIYISDLKVMDFTTKYTIDNQLFEVPNALHPRYANKADKGFEALSGDEDTVYYRDLLESALIAFRNAEYLQTIDQLEVILRRYPQDDNALFYSALSQSERGKPDRAIVLLKKLNAKKHSAFLEEATWHLALAYKASGQEAEAKNLLSEISAKNGFYAPQSRILLAK